jgi:hypothetical protein
MAYAMNSWVLGEGFNEVLGVHRTDNHDTIAATLAKGVVRLGTVTRSRLLWYTGYSFVPDPPRGAVDGLVAMPVVQLANGPDRAV